MFFCFFGGACSLYVAYNIWDDLKDSRSSNPDNWSLANLVIQMNLHIVLKFAELGSKLHLITCIWITSDYIRFQKFKVLVIRVNYILKY